MSNDIKLSPSGIKSFEDCRAGYLFSRLILPRVDTQKALDTVHIGRKFHKLAEYEFDKDVEEEMLAYDNKKNVETLKDFATILKKRDYYNLPSIKEEYMSIDVRDFGTIIGIPDRVVDLGDGRILVVDYKTSVFCYPDLDRRQIMSYAYMLWKDKGVDPDKIEILIDYVRANQVFRYALTRSDLERHENYLISRFKAVKKLISDWETHKDVTKITHTPGNCNLCFMVGICIPYHIYRNPHFDPINIIEMRTEDLIREKIEREEFRKMNEDRIKAINRSLMDRYERNPSEPDEEICAREVIDEYLTRVQQTVETYDTERVARKYVSERANKMLKGTPFKGMVDTQYLENEITNFIVDILPQKLSRESVPADIRKKLDNYRERSSRTPYLRVK